MTTTQPTEKPGLDKIIDDLLREMEGVNGDSPEYDKMSDQLVKLMKLKSEVGRKRISPDTWAGIMANLAGILIIVGYERAHIVTSKALPFIRRP